MDIKKYDIVRFKGKNYHVQRIDQISNEIRLIGAHWVEESDVTLVESVIIPEFKIGDEVLIHPVPSYEKSDYPTGWDSQMDNMINEKPHKIRDYDSLDDSYLIDDFWFLPYHLEKVKAYDMV